MHIKSLFTAILLILFSFSLIMAQNSEKVASLLEEVDSWVVTDTARIMNYIDSTKAVTLETLKSSKYWDQVENDLSFLLGIDLINSPQIDNTGRIYFRMRLTGEQDAIFYVDEPGGWPIQLTPNNWSSEGVIISGYDVDPSGDYVLVRVNKFGDEMHDIWYFSRDGQFRPLLESRDRRYTGVILDDKNPDRFFLYIMEKENIHFAKYTISTGSLDTLYHEPGSIYPVAYHNDTLAFLRYESFSESQLYILDVNTKKSEAITTRTHFGAVTFTDDGRILCLSKIRSRAWEFMKFCIMDPAKPKGLEVIYDPGMETDEFYFDRKRGIAIVAMNEDGYSSLKGFDLEGNDVPMPEVEIGVINEYYGGAIRGNDKGEIVFSYSSPKTPPTAYKFNLNENKLKQIGSVSTFGFDFSDINVEVIRYDVGDTIDIPSLIYMPSNAKKDGSNPAIISYHGGPPSQSRPWFQRNIAFALSKGFIVMFPNVRGSSGYGPAYEEADNGKRRFTALKDAEGAIDYLINEGYSSPDKIAIWGGSYGGYTVNWLATHAADKIACVISQIGVSDIEHMFKYTGVQSFVTGYEKEYGERGSELIHKLSPVFYADQAKKPILFKTGFYDPRVPPSDSRRFVYVLNKLGVPVWLYEETESGHGGSSKSQVIFDLTSSYVFTMMHVMK